MIISSDICAICNRSIHRKFGEAHQNYPWYHDSPPIFGMYGTDDHPASPDKVTRLTLPGALSLVDPPNDQGSLSISDVEGSVSFVEEAP